MGWFALGWNGWMKLNCFEWIGLTDWIGLRSNGLVKILIRLDGLD